MPHGDNDYPNPDNFPLPSFRTPIPPPSVDPDEGELWYVAYNPAWHEVLGAATQALLQPTTWEGDHDAIILAQNRANTLTVMLQSPVTVADGISPFWDDPDGADADGEATDNTYTWSERIEDWAIAAFVASSGVPGAAAAYLTIAPRFRLLFKRGDWGGIANIFLDGDLIGTVDTYSATPDIVAFDVVVPP